MSALVVAVATFMVAGSACAAIKWSTVNTGTCTGTALLSTCVASTATSSKPGLSLRAYSDTASGAQIADAYIGIYSGGTGVTSRAGPNSAATAYNAAGQQESTTSPNHAMDNNGNYEMQLLSFTSAVTLNEVQLGYYNTDSDISVLAYTGSGTPTLTGRTFSNLTTFGWSIVGNYANVYQSSVGTDANAIAINTSSTPLSSSYWLIGAYNSTFGTGLTTGNDYVKLLAVYGAVPRFQTPEPSSLALLAVAIAGIVGVSRRRGGAPAA